MLAYKPRYGANLGQSWADLTGGLTSGLARQIVTEAEPVVRQVVRDERNRLAEAIMGAIPFFSVSAIAYVASRYLIPDGKKTAKGVGYIASAASALGGAWWALSTLTEKPEIDTINQAQPGTTNKTVDAVAQNAAKAIVAEAAPKIQQLVEEERIRLAEAGQVMIPFAVGAMATFLATFFLVGSDETKIKAAGYTGTALVLGTGAWLAMDKLKAA